MHEYIQHYSGMLVARERKRLLSSKYTNPFDETLAVFVVLEGAFVEPIPHRMYCYIKEIECFVAKYRSKTQWKTDFGCCGLQFLRGDRDKFVSTPNLTISDAFACLCERQCVTFQFQLYIMRWLSLVVTCANVRLARSMLGNCSSVDIIITILKIM